MTDIELPEGASITLMEDGRKRFLLRMKDQYGQAFRKRYATAKLATKDAWAKAEEFARGASASDATIERVWADLKERLRGNVTPGHYERVERIAQALIRDGLNDLKRPDYGTRFAKWLQKLEANWWVGLKGDGKFQRKSPHTLSVAHKDTIQRQAQRLVRHATQMAPPLLTVSPLASLDRLLTAGDHKVIPTFALSELRVLVSDKARWNGRFGQGDPWWLPACLGAYTGARPVEFMHLRWEWIRWEEEKIQLRNYNCPVTGKPLIKLKTGEGVIPLEPELRDILLPIAKPSGWIIESEDMRVSGSCVKSRDRTKAPSYQYTNGFDLYMERVGVTKDDRYLYCLRHNHITIQLAMGIQEARVMRWHRHGEFDTTKGYAMTVENFAGAVDHWGTEFYLRRPEPARDRAAPVLPKFLQGKDTLPLDDDTPIVIEEEAG